ncbi:hypothetical protein KR009_009123 [Drosophila setifemur]|nr:hypothetical protein KR009_009123 [Drosophila setifemur]
MEGVSMSLSESVLMAVNDEKGLPAPIGVLEETELSSLEGTFVAPAAVGSAATAAPVVASTSAAAATAAAAAAAADTAATATPVPPPVENSAEAIADELAHIREIFVAETIKIQLTPEQAVAMTMCLNKYEGIVARLSVHAIAPAVVALPPAAYATAYRNVVGCSGDQGPEYVGQGGCRKGALGVGLHEELYKNNFAEHMDLAAFSKAVHLENIWSVTDGPTANVTLNVDPTALDVLDGGKAYIGWFAYNCRALVRTYACHGCVGFDHKVAQCYKDNDCRQCGQTGHSARGCTNPVDCRNCRFKDYASGHHMLSPGCPAYAAVLARHTANSTPTMYLRYMDAVLLQASRTPASLGLDAVSPMWLSRLSRHAEGRANYNRGELLSEWMLEKGAVALNQPSEVFMFDNLRAHSDIDVTIVNDAASMWSTYERRVDVWELSDHNMITVAATPTTKSTVESIAPVPSWNFSNARWRLFEEEMVRRSTELPEDF